ncbi:F-box/kelch-repeat protein At1g16250 isoform X1 [Phoenix dactylifera]|uniref:F-box/kelch-repeat protein At1g16250 isoform X1 n=1 Tax=Phoenix dactylifera TaxID=42345 RepID=A0A8B9AI71_PHODC|nr:F-box/kelch-repeat protein At1g16250 isoform X1 [Phoenix dactylifera]
MEEEPVGDDREYQAIIPGLPDDLALRCLARISHGYHGLLECISRKWRDAIRSMDYAHMKARHERCGNWLFVSTADGKGQWDAYDPDADRWHPLPTVPTDCDESFCGFSCVSVCKKFLVIGGCYLYNKRSLAINDVILFDPFKKQWKRAANMQTARTDFACAVISNKVYVAGGGNSSCTGGLSSVEVYDPCADRWEDLPPMPFTLIECFSISYGGQFHVLGKREYNIQQDTYLIFNPVNQHWCIMEDLQLFCKLTHNYTTIQNGNIYTILEEGSIKKVDMDQKVWCTLGEFPAVVLPKHMRSLKPFTFGFVAFQQYLYVIGGMTLKYNLDTLSYGIVKLNSNRFCDMRKLPLEWKDARPMPIRSGRILGCAVMEE